MTKSLFSGPVKDILHPKDVGNCLLCYILTTSDSVSVPWTGPGHVCKHLTWGPPDHEDNATSFFHNKHVLIRLNSDYQIYTNVRTQ